VGVERAAEGIEPTLRLILGLVLVGGVLGAAAPALAAQPTLQGCLGESVAGGAQAVHPYGGLVSSVAKATGPGNRPGVGDEVQAIQAGNVPDVVFPNTCND
jgi:hypothetical protein